MFGAEENAEAPSNQEQFDCPPAKKTSRSSPRYRDVQRESTNRAAMDNVCTDMKQRELEAVASWHERRVALSQLYDHRGANLDVAARE